MKEIRFATTNKGKVHSVSRTLAGYGITVVPFNKELPEPRTDDLAFIALEKAIAAFRLLNQPVIAVDSGFFVHSLNGFPKSFVNFTLDTIGLEGILTLARGKDRSCEFCDCLAYFDGQITKTFVSKVSGTLAEEARGELQPSAWSVLWRVFVPDGEEQTLAEMSEEEINGWRKRRRGSSFAKQFGEWFTQI